MELMILVALAAGLSLGLWLLTVAAVAYALWRYVWRPWCVVRRDHDAVRQELEAFRAERREALLRTEADEARIERNLRARLYR